MTPPSRVRGRRELAIGMTGAPLALEGKSEHSRKASLKRWRSKS
ncbi:MAG: hypothetical protein ACRD4G_00180 [Bryobacteraceae bacterium]